MAATAPGNLLCITAAALLRRMNDPTLAPTLASGLFFREQIGRFATGHPRDLVLASPPGALGVGIRTDSAPACTMVMPRLVASQPSSQLPSDPGVSTRRGLAMGMLLADSAGRAGESERLACGGCRAGQISGLCCACREGPGRRARRRGYRCIAGAPAPRPRRLHPELFPGAFVVIWASADSNNLRQNPALIH